MRMTCVAALLLVPAVSSLTGAERPSFVNDIVPIFTKSGCAKLELSRLHARPGRVQAVSVWL